MLATFGNRAVRVGILFSTGASQEVGQVPLAVVPPGFPVISAPDPAPGDFSTDREADRRTRVRFTYERKNPDAAVLVWCLVGFECFMVYDGTSFLGIFDGFCSVEEVEDEVFRFDILPAGGWWGQVEFFGADGVIAGTVL